MDNNAALGNGIAKNISLPFATIAVVSGLVKQKIISCLQLTQLILGRIDTIDGRLNSYITVMHDDAMAAAKALDDELAAGHYRGPLHGIPIGLKDILYTNNAPTSAGHVFKANDIPSFNATVVNKLVAAGAIMIGKQNLCEGAMCGYNDTAKIAINPWGADLWTGISSSGSAIATAAGLCYGSIASDTGGSIRFPSLANGITGLKPTYGLVSRYGVHPLSPSMDHIGPLSRSVFDAAIILEVIAGHDPKDPTSLPVDGIDIFSSMNDGIRGLKIGIDPSYNSKVTDHALLHSIDAAIQQLEGLGAIPVPLKMPGTNDELLGTWFTICSREAFEANRETWPSLKDKYGKNYESLLETGSLVTDEQYQDAKGVQNRFRHQFISLLKEVDAVITPAGGMARGVTDSLWRSKDSVLAELGDQLNMHFALPANIAGIPALTIPCGQAIQGLPPPAMQLMGAPLSEAKLCRIGYAFEKATGWNKQHPPV